jgi:PAS domain S-box-containing protein
VLSEELHRARRRARPQVTVEDADITSERKVEGGFAFALACLSVIGMASYLALTRQHEDSIWVEHTREVISRIEQLYAKSTDAQNGRRGYVVTGDEITLEPYYLMQHTLADDVQQLRALTGDNPLQLQRLTTLESLIHDELEFSAAVIAAYQASGFEAARIISKTGRGRQLHDQTRELVQDMKQTEETLLKARQQDAINSATFVQAVIIGGGVIAFLGLGLALYVIRRDFARRRRAEAERDRFFQLSLDMQCIASADGYFKRVNPAVQEMLGWTPEEFLAQPFMEFVHPDDHAATQLEVDKQIVSGQRVIQFENRYRHKDGSWRVLSWASVPHGNLMYAVARDTTRRRQADNEIARLNQDLQARAAQLEAVNKELEAFSYSVSHDLRAPLRHVQGYVQLLTREEQSSLSDTAARYLKTISAAAREMGQLIDDLLSFSRMGRMEMRAGDIDLNPIVNAVRAELEMVTQNRNIHWQIATLPRVMGDKAMLKQVLVNLIDNAVKYTRGRDPAVIEVGCAGADHLQPGQMIFFVRDNGAGFDMRYVDKLFGVFQRLHRADEFEGTGIGLANVRRIIMRHGGRTWAEAEPDIGATIYFTLKPADTMINGDAA